MLALRNQALCVRSAKINVTSTWVLESHFLALTGGVLALRNQALCVRPACNAVALCHLVLRGGVHGDDDLGSCYSVLSRSVGWCSITLCSPTNLSHLLQAFCGTTAISLSTFFPIDIYRLNRLAIGSVQDLSCRSNRNPWVAGTQMLDQDLGGLEPPALEDLAHFGRGRCRSPARPSETDQAELFIGRRFTSASPDCRGNCWGASCSLPSISCTSTAWISDVPHSWTGGQLSGS